MERLQVVIKSIVFKDDKTLFIAKADIIKNYNNLMIPGFDYITVIFNYINVFKDDIFDLEGELELTKYGYTFKATSASRTIPAEKKALVKYLENQNIGVGKTLSARIIDELGISCITKIKEDHKCLLSVKGISEEKALLIQKNISTNLDLEKIIITLMINGFTVDKCYEIFNKYGKSSLNTLYNDPYELLSIKDIQYTTIENIAKLNGIKHDSIGRIKGAILEYIKVEMKNKGDIFVYKEDIINNLNDFLNKINIYKELIDTAKIDDFLINNENNDLVVEKGKYVYLKMFNYLENNIIRNLFSKNNEEVIKYNYDLNEELSQEQKDIIDIVFNNNISILTGGPGTGKTYTINKIIKEWQKATGEEPILLSPTGKAADRLSKVSGIKASTIHRTLKIYNDGESDVVLQGLVIIDESTMIDIFIFNKVLESLDYGSKLLLVGDPDQLPAVGIGLIFRDLIESKLINTVKLEKIHRQSDDSNIIINSKLLINEKDMIINNKDFKDFYFIEASDDLDIKNKIIKSIDRLVINHKMEDIQILTPMKGGLVGSIGLNSTIQEKYNTNKYHLFNNKSFKVGDRVIQTKNNYELNIFNGDCGIITEIGNDYIEVDYEYINIRYTGDYIKELELSYSITIHKSQGSEFNIVIIPITPTQKILNTKNLLYTGITRGKDKIILIGDKKELEQIKYRKDNIIRNSNIIPKMEAKWNSIF